jgi:hypothetical protein
MENKIRLLPGNNSYLAKFEVAKRNLNLQSLDEKKSFVMINQWPLHNLAKRRI